MILWQLFLSFLQIGAFSFGGGYAALPLIQNQVVDIHGWLTAAEFSRLVTISQMTPGPIAINSATFIGLQVAGPLGAIVATLACILPSCILVSLLTYLYMKYKNMTLLQSVLSTLRPAVIALIATAGLSILFSAIFGQTGHLIVTQLKMPMLVIFIICLYLLKKGKNPILIMFMAGLLNLGQYYLINWLE